MIPSAVVRIPEGVALLSTYGTVPHGDLAEKSPQRTGGLAPTSRRAHGAYRRRTRKPGDRTLARRSRLLADTNGGMHTPCREKNFRAMESSHRGLPARARQVASGASTPS